VGSKNYLYFLATIVSVSIFTTISLGLSLAFLIEVFAFEQRLTDRLAASGEEVVGVVGIQTISIISVVLLLPLVGLVYQLVGFHCMLIYQGITTYEFVVQEQKKMRDKLEVPPKSKAVGAKKTSDRVPSEQDPALGSHAQELRGTGGTPHDGGIVGDISEPLADQVNGLGLRNSGSDLQMSTRGNPRNGAALVEVVV
jgi:DHHC palmitoyltransferase